VPLPARSAPRFHVLPMGKDYGTSDALAHIIAVLIDKLADPWRNLKLCPKGRGTLGNTSEAYGRSRLTARDLPTFFGSNARRRGPELQPAAPCKTRDERLPFNALCGTGDPPRLTSGDAVRAYDRFREVLSWTFLMHVVKTFNFRGTEPLAADAAHRRASR